MAKILVIDDEEQLRDLLKKMLTRDGHQVFMAQDGEEGVRSFHQFKPDLIITDIIMPNKDGITLIKDLRAIANYKFTPMLTLTTESGMEKKMEGKAAGATGWIVKPFDPDQLLKTLKNLKLN